jgi:hypothetical protein
MAEFMGIFTSLIDKVRKGAERVGYALGVVEKIDAGKPLGVFRGFTRFEGKSRCEVLAEMYTGFDETAQAKKELETMPRDNIDSFELTLAKISYQPAIHAFDKAKEVLYDRRIRNFRRNLIDTITEYKSGSWRQAEYFAVSPNKEGFVRSNVDENSVKNTVYYAMKLVSNGTNERDSELLELASRITGKDYSKSYVK